jgi:hypothetical protein
VILGINNLSHIVEHHHVLHLVRFLNYLFD